MEETEDLLSAWLSGREGPEVGVRPLQLRNDEPA